MCSQKCDAGHENNSGREKADVRLISKLIFEADFEADFEASKPKNLKNGSHPRNIMPKKRFCLASLGGASFARTGAEHPVPLFRNKLYCAINSLFRYKLPSFPKLLPSGKKSNSPLTKILPSGKKSNSPLPIHPQSPNCFTPLRY